MHVIQINGYFFKVTQPTLEEVELLVATLYGTCCEPFLSELNTLLGKIYFTNPKTEAVAGLVNHEFIL